MNSEGPAEGRTDEESRRIHASSDAVYRALLDPDARVAWLPPVGMSARIEHFDARTGGSYRMVLTYDDPTISTGKSAAGTDVVEASFVELRPGERVVEAVTFESTDPTLAAVMTMTWALTPIGDGTLVTVTARNVPTGISAEDHATGMQSSLENLATYVESAHRIEPGE